MCFIDIMKLKNLHILFYLIFVLFTKIKAEIQKTRNIYNSKNSNDISRANIILKNHTSYGLNIASKCQHIKSLAPKGCPNDLFQCQDETCILSRYRCNGQDDCTDKSDEHNCPCQEDEFRCTNGSCVKKLEVCIINQPFKTCTLDNYDCNEFPCLYPKFRCKNGQCITYKMQCNFEFDCLDRSDENDCVCDPDAFRCDNGACKSKATMWCDRFPDCEDKSDEPENCTCDTEQQFKCDNGRCIAIYNQCNLQDDCKDGSDEVDCPFDCNESHDLFLCNNGVCIPKSFLCDRKVDCEDLSDETNCSLSIKEITRLNIISCPSEKEFPCLDGSGCTSITSWCDGHRDCQDYGDELPGCHQECPSTFWKCDLNKCLPIIRVCDGNQDCADSSDEVNCTCQNGNIPCASGICINPSFFCDGENDCGDGSDEDQCDCASLIHLRFPERICDGYADCFDYSDELSCNECSFDQISCLNISKCIKQTQVCDGVIDCEVLQEDEHNCFTLSPDDIVQEDALGVPEYNNEGYLRVRMKGKWYMMCADNWDDRDATIFCKHLKFRNLAFTYFKRQSDAKTLAIEEDCDLTSLFSELNHTKYLTDRKCHQRKVVYISCMHIECGINTNGRGVQERIVGGRDTNPGKWPWHATIYSNGIENCGATLISNSWIATAAHCFKGFETLYDFTVRLGSWRSQSISPYDAIIQVDHVVYHPDFNGHGSAILGFNADLALAHLSIPVKFSNFIRPICLPKESMKIRDRALVKAVGFGRTHTYAAGPIAETLQDVDLRTISNKNCLHFSILQGGITPNMICAIAEKNTFAGTCKGDSGGGLFTQDQTGKWVLAGITSFGFPCARSNLPDIFTRVSKFVSWIKKNINESISNDNAITVNTSFNCLGHKCSLGNCIAPNQVCDKTNDCFDLGDEVPCRQIEFPNVNCDFENGSICGYKQDKRINFKHRLLWQRGSQKFWMNKTFKTYSGSHNGVFLFISNDLLRPDMTQAKAKLISPYFNLTSASSCLQFSYIIQSNTIQCNNSVKLTVYLENSKEQILLWNRTKSTEVWKNVHITLPFSGHYTLLFEGSLQRNDFKFIAFDSVKIHDNRC